MSENPCEALLKKLLNAHTNYWDMRRKYDSIILTSSKEVEKAAEPSGDANEIIDPRVKLKSELDRLEKIYRKAEQAYFECREL